MLFGGFVFLTFSFSRNIFLLTAGEDLYTFEDAVKPNTGSFYVRQIVGSTNYPTGTDPIDFSHGFLNYQVSTDDALS